jgi:hypothetical protein
MLYNEIIAVCSEIHTKHTNTLCGQNVPRSKHTPSQKNQSVNAVPAVCSQIHTKHINTLCGQNVPRSKHSVSVIKTSQLMLYSEIIAVCS